LIEVATKHSAVCWLRPIGKLPSAWTNDLAGRYRHDVPGHPALHRNAGSGDDGPG